MNATSNSRNIINKINKIDNGENTNPAAGFVFSPLSIFFILFMMFLELLVAFIQAFVFTFLSALYIGFAVEEHH